MRGRSVARPPKGTDPGITPAPLPPGFRVVLDHDTRAIDGGSTLVGGSPLTVLRLSAAGAALVADLAAGRPVPATAEADRLVRRLLDLGLAHPRPPSGRPAPPVTVVIPVRDDAAGLTTTLAHLGPTDRVVVVDDGSTDPEAVRRAVEAGPQPGRTQVIRLGRSQGPGGARQAGLQVVTTEVVAFVDAGCRTEPGWLAPVVDHLADPAVAAVAPRIRPGASPGAPGWLVAYEEIRSPLDLGPTPSAVRPHARVPYVPTATLVVRRAVLDDVAGFDPTLRVGEDVDLVWRLVAAGWVVRYEPAGTVVHPVRPTLGGLLRQRFDYGSSAALLAERHGDAVAPLVASTWSVAAWGLVLLGHPLAGAALAGASTARLVARLPALRHPGKEALRLAGGGHLRAGRLVAQACRRTWWPLVLVGCLSSRRVRRAALLAAVMPPLLERRPPASTLTLPGWLALRLLDDLAYGAGVWAGAARTRSAASLRPHLTPWPGPSRLARRARTGPIPPGPAMPPYGL